MNTAALASPGHRFWPVGEAAQANYEALRAQVLTTGAMPDSLIATRFARRGLPGLIAWPSADPVFDAALLGAHLSGFGLLWGIQFVLLDRVLFRTR